MPSIHPKTEEQKLHNLRLKYRETFKTDDDLVVLFDILNRCGYWDSHNSMNITAEEFMARNAIARYIQFMIGGVQEMNGIEILKAMNNLPYNKEMI